MPQTNTENQYSLWIGLIFIFNIIVGTGALTLPAAFAKAGWALGTISIIFLAFVSYINATYVIETMACANAILKFKSLCPANRIVSIQAAETEDSSDENTPMRVGNTAQESLLVNISSQYYSLDNRVELGEMTKLFFNPVGRVAFYITMIIYLYGDLSIYSAAIGKSTVDIICSYQSENYNESSIPKDMPCFNTTADISSPQFTKLECYRIILVAFICLLGPFVFFNVQKTKHLQIFTTIMRWLAFGIMITLAIVSLSKNGARGKPPAFDMGGIPALFGACIYSFMCHHSLPGMVAPITSKRRLWPTLCVDFGLIGIFYLLLALTGIFAFKDLKDLYTLNFIPTADSGVFLKILEYFLTLFPVFTLTTTFPVLAITLRNNIQGMVLDMSRIESYNLFLRRILFPFIAIIPPLIITMFFEDITKLVSFTGSFAGTGIQYLIPTFLVLTARKKCNVVFPPSIQNNYESPFKHRIWAFLIIAWSIICIVMVSWNLLDQRVSVF